jgi:predicted secreted protein
MQRAKLIGAVAQLLIATAGQMVQAQPPHSSTTVTGGDAAANTQVKLGRELAVKLAGNPSTGYTWRPPAAVAARLVLKAQYFEGSAAGQPARPGAGGTQVFVFDAVAAGIERLHFEYRRGQTGSPLRTYDLTVTVTP